MAGLLLDLRRQIARNRRKDAYGTPHTENPVIKAHTNEKVKIAEESVGPQIQEELQEEQEVQEVQVQQELQDMQDCNIQERNIDTVSKEDFLLNQIDEFRERARQLQSLLNTKESEAQELQTLVDERQEKADALGQILKEREEKADGITAEVERQIDALIEKVAAKMDEIESTMQEDVADGKRFNEAKAQELKQSLGQIQEQLTNIKTELSDKVHTENVKCYRNISDLFKSMEDKLDRLTIVEDKLVPIRIGVIVAGAFGILNFISMLVLILINLGVFA